MSLYPTVEAAVLTLVRSYSGGAVYGVANSSRNDWSVRHGEHDESAVIGMWQRSQFGRSLNGRAQQGKRQELHYPRISLLVAIGQAENGDGAAVTAVVNRAGSLVAYLNQYGRLGLGNAAGITRAEVVNMGIPELIGSIKTERTTHARIDLDMEVACEIEMIVIESGG